MAKLKLIALFSGGVLTGALAMNFAPGLIHTIKQPYAGQETRQISSLSSQDIKQLTDGAGWGLAKPAELNGFPGPAHVLELAKELQLDANQTTQIQKIFDEMNASARVLGARLIKAEAQLDKLFKDREAEPELLNIQLQSAENVRAQLRAAHLLAHLETSPILSEEQRATYKELRGYAGGHAGHKGH